MDSFRPIETERLRLEPLPRDTARLLVAGDLGDLRPGDGWPHADTLDAIRMALGRGHPPGWLVMLDDRVIGDCGVHAPPNEHGEIELGFGLSAHYRGQGYGSELAAALSQWLLALPDVRLVVARAYESNLASRRALERAGFEIDSVRNGYIRFTLS